MLHLHFAPSLANLLFHGIYSSLSQTPAQSAKQPPSRSSKLPCPISNQIARCLKQNRNWRLVCGKNVSLLKEVGENGWKQELDLHYFGSWKEHRKNGQVNDSDGGKNPVVECEIA
ncbi:hypothetical protein NL676_019304 [Syzygium grande]|nr:hypothetical protein NL676_019304 [Syzygium grande]